MVAATEHGLRESASPRLRHRYALLLAERGEPDRALVEMRAAADGGDYRAMSDLALWLSNEGNAEALAWARRATAAAPEYDQRPTRLHGKIALLAAHEPAEALAAFEVAYALEPDNLREPLQPRARPSSRFPAAPRIPNRILAAATADPPRFRAARNGRDRAFVAVTPRVRAGEYRAMSSLFAVVSAARARSRLATRRGGRGAGVLLDRARRNRRRR